MPIVRDDNPNYVWSGPKIHGVINFDESKIMRNFLRCVVKPEGLGQLARSQSPPPTIRTYWE